MTQLVASRFANFILNKVAVRAPNGTLENIDLSRLSVADYQATYATIHLDDYCDYKLSTVFLVFNGFAFSFALATLFLVAVVPVFIRRQHWDAYLARVGAICMTLTLIFFVVAFLLAGFVTAGVGMPPPADCDGIGASDGLFSAVATGKIPNSQSMVVSASAYATLAMIVVLIILVTFLSLKETIPRKELRHDSADSIV